MTGVMTEWAWVWAGYAVTAVTWAAYVAWALRGSRGRRAAGADRTRR